MSISTLQKHNNLLIEKFSKDKTIEDFRAGDTILAKIKIVEGASERVASLQGVCVSRRNKGLMSSCVIRKISHGIGVEKTILIHSPLVLSISVVRRGRVRRAVLNYLRDLPGALKIRDRFNFKKTKGADKAKKTKSTVNKKSKEAAVNKTTDNEQ